MRPALTLIGCSNNDSDKKFPSMRRNNRQLACKIGYSIAIAQQTHTHTHTELAKSRLTHTHSYTHLALVSSCLWGERKCVKRLNNFATAFFFPIFSVFNKNRRHAKGGTAAESEITVGTHDCLQYYYYNIIDIE